MSATPQPIAAAIEQAARALGFVRVGWCSAEPFERGAEALDAWLAHGMHGSMSYMAEQPHRADPRSLLPEAKSALVVAMQYGDRSENGGGNDSGSDSGTAQPKRGIVARFARGIDYHGVLKAKLAALLPEIEKLVGRSVTARACVDTAPILEREAAAAAGLGFFGKNTMLIVPGVGSYLLLGVLLLDMEPPPAPPETPAPAKPRCGSCTACMDVCPTDAFAAPFRLDARRCISYLTIEQRGAIPAPLRSKFGNMLFGCDLCQQACPFNAGRNAAACAPELSPRPELTAPDLEQIVQLGSSPYRRLVRGTALRRVSRPLLARNAAVALGNSGSRESVAVLAGALKLHRSALVRSHIVWALGQLGGDEAEALLESLARSGEEAPEVRDEAAAQGCSAPPE